MKTEQVGDSILETWTVDEIAAMFPQTLGMDLVNPAPPQAPRT